MYFTGHYRLTILMLTLRFAVIHSSLVDASSLTLTLLVVDRRRHESRQLISRLRKSAPRMSPLNVCFTTQTSRSVAMSCCYRFHYCPSHQSVRNHKQELVLSQLVVAASSLFVVVIAVQREMQLTFIKASPAFLSLLRLCKALYLHRMGQSYWLPTNSSPFTLRAFNHVGLCVRGTPLQVHKNPFTHSVYECLISISNNHSLLINALLG